MNWQGRDIQIVAFAVPFPPDYGGVIDVFHKIRALKETGVRVHLHSFRYKQHQPHPDLEALCTSVHYYNRSISSQYIQGWPYIVASRYDKTLLRNVLNAGYPVLLEGLHTSWLVPHLEKACLKHLVRMHNIEWKYYQMLATKEPSFVRKKYFLEESARLKQFESIVSKTVILAISPIDEAYLKQHYPLTDIRLIHPFHSFDKAEIAIGKGNYALFHGNLAINENELAALWLVQSVFAKTGFSLIIAGKQPSERLKLAISPYKHIRLVADPSTKEMQQLQVNAQFHLLPNQQPTGMKLKWANALFTARFIIAHPDMAGSGKPEAGIWSAYKPEEYIRIIHSMKETEMNQDIIHARVQYLDKDWSNKENALRIAEILLQGE